MKIFKYLKSLLNQNIIMESWIDKYKPTKLSEVLGDTTQIKLIENFIKQFTVDNESTKIINPNLIISGTNGIGKTLVVDLVLKENNMEKITGDLSNISINLKSKKKRKMVKEYSNSDKSIIAYYMSLRNGTKFLTNGGKIERKIALVFDDVSNISNPKEKEAIKAIIQTNNRFQKFPIIIITNTKHSKIVNELKKMVTYNKDISNSIKCTKKITNEIVMKPPSHYELEGFIKKICSIEKLNLVCNTNDNIYIEIVEHAQYDVRRMINILEELKLIYKDSEVTIEKFHQYCNISKTKDLDPGIHEATRTLLNKYTNMNDALSLYSEERATIPLMVHENYPLNIRQQYPRMSPSEQIDIMFDISKSISMSDKIDGIIYSNQCWNLQPVHGFYSCVIPSYHINKKPNKLCKREIYKYTQDYNKTSIKKINNKVIKKAQDNWTPKMIALYDFLYIASILKNLMEQQKFEKIAELMKPYNLKIKEIESIIKIDKVKKPKNILTSKQRTILKELLGNK